MSKVKEVVIKVNNTHKEFKLPHEKNTTVKGIFTSILSGKSFSKKYEIQNALNGISFEIEKGEFFGIVGRNGSGKSTLLKMLAGIYQPTKGRVSTKGRVVPFIELGVGFNGELSGRENVYLNGAVLGFSKIEIEEKYSRIVEFAELEKFMDQKLKNYSSGMQVRLAFSVATILADSDILLIDEVLAVGDSSFQRKCFEYFRHLKKIKKTVVFVTHDMSAIREYCDRALILNEGKVFKIGKPNNIADAYYDLFSKNNTDDTNTRVTSKRSGDGTITHEKISVDVSDKKIKISTKVKINKNVSEPVFGYRLKSSAGLNIMGTNTRFERVKTGNFLKGDESNIKWEFDNMLSDGKYYLDFSVSSRDGTFIYDRLTDGHTFRVTKKDINPYPISPSTTVSINKGNR